jgi:hypothetical protein
MAKPPACLVMRDEVVADARLCKVMGCTKSSVSVVVSVVNEIGVLSVIASAASGWSSHSEVSATSTQVVDEGVGKFSFSSSLSS